MDHKNNSTNQYPPITNEKIRIAGSEIQPRVSLSRYLVATIVPLFLLVVVISILMVERFNDIAMLEDEIIGIEVAGELNRAVTALQKVRGLWQIRLQGGKTSASSWIDELQIELESVLAGIIEGKSSARFKFRGQLRILRDELKKLAAKPVESSLVRAVFEEHSAHVARLLNMMRLVAARSSLIHDPNQETHQLMELVVKRFPEAAEALGRFRGIASGLGMKDAFTEADNILLQVSRADLEREVKNLMYSYHAVVMVLPKSEKYIEFDVAGFINSTMSFAQDVVNMFKAPKKNIDAYKLFARATILIESSLILHNEAASHLRALVKQRLSSQRDLVVYSILLVMLIMLLVWYFVAAFYRSNHRLFKQLILDVAIRKKAEVALRKSEASLSEAQRMAQIGSWKLDLTSNKVEWSEEIYRIFEINPRQFGASHETFMDVIHPEDRERVSTAYTESIKNKTAYSVKHRLCMTDGRIKHVQLHCETFYNNDGSPIRSVGTVQDITEQYQADQFLKKLNRSLQALSACNEVLVRAADEMDLLNKVCHIIVEISGYRLAWVGFVEHDEAKTIRPVAQAGWEEDYLDTVKLTWADTERGRGPGGTAVRTGKYCITRDVHSDSHFEPWRTQAIKRGYASVVGLPLAEGDNIFGVLLVYASEVNSFDEEEVRLLQELVDDLAYGIVTLRSRQERHQLNKQLRQAQKMEAIGQLTGGIAHDFNNILTSILGFTSLALQRFVKDDQPKLREYLNEVLRAGERARDLVSQMLAFSRTGSSTASRLSIPPMIKEVIKMLRGTLPSSIGLSSQFATDVPAVMMDPVQLQQVLMNMCINARDAMDDKGRIDIRARRVRIDSKDQGTVLSVPNGGVLRHTCGACHNEIEHGDYVELSIQDTGIGISDDDLERIFEPFFTTKDVDKGTGMGLSMVYGIIHKHGGHILVDTELGIGTTFRLLLPVAEDASIHESDIELDASPIAESLNDARILIVDDEESIGRFMGDLLESRGGKVTVLTDSQAALDLFSQDPEAFDLIITDQTMPGLTGTELAQKVLALRPALPMILCTGYSEHVDEAKAKALGICGYLTKPMETDKLLGLVKALLKDILS